MISLQKRLALTYSVFLCAILASLAVVANIVTENFFKKFVTQTIDAKNKEIVRAVYELYNPWEKQFPLPTLEAVGMLFMHDGFVIDLENPEGKKIWDARAMDMEHCVLALQKINERMRVTHGIHSELRNIDFPLYFGEEMIGTVYIASVGPFFYTEAQSEFISQLNKLLAASALVFIMISISISVVLAATLARPIKAASGAARAIAEHYRRGNTRGDLKISLKEGYYTAELSELSRSINELSCELAEAERRQRQLTSDIAHELRTPLTGLQGTIEAFIDGVWDPTPERLSTLLSETRRLTSLVEDIRILTSLEWERLTLNKTDFDIAELVTDCAEQFRSAAEEKRIAIVVQTLSAFVYADYDRLKQVIINLVSNALKYTDEGKITLGDEYHTREQGDKALIIFVADTGIGIAPEDLPRVFERFYRTDKSRNSGTGGSGIGLTIAAAIVATHGWELRAESEAGQGSVFKIIVPEA
jgi:signal transduction histidine kinase